MLEKEIKTTKNTWIIWNFVLLLWLRFSRVFKNITRIYFPFVKLSLAKWIFNIYKVSASYGKHLATLHKWPSSIVFSHYHTNQHTVFSTGLNVLRAIVITYNMKKMAPSRLNYCAILCFAYYLDDDSDNDNGKNYHLLIT